jgi:predicted esterase
MEPTLHANQPVYSVGAPLEQARAAVICIHGRGAPARDILALASEIDAPNVAYLAPQAANNTWYPNRFIMPVASNEPWLTSALDLLDGLVAQLGAQGFAPERVALLGFSQGACLALEYAARHPRRYGGLAGLSGALIENGDRPRAYTGDLAGTPVFLGCADEDFHIPAGRVERTADVLTRLGAAVTTRIYPDLGHTVNRDEIEQVEALVRALAQPHPGA